MEIKSAKDNEVFEKQLITYLRLANKPCGLVLNFNHAKMKDGITRVKNGYILNDSSRRHGDTEGHGGDFRK